MLLDSGIEYVGIHYRAAEHIATLPISEEALKEAWKEVSRLATFYANAKNYIVIHAVRHTLEVYHADASLIKAYSVGLGKNGVRKTANGDCKTPIGTYQILWKASRYAETDGGFLIAEGASYCGKDNAFLLKSEHDKGAIWGSDYGGDQAVFLCLDYPNLQDQSNGFTDYGIAIHASQTGIGEDSSRGCIRMTPADARDLYNKVAEGTAVFIQND